MRRFPSEFSQLLTPLGQRALKGKFPGLRFKENKTPFALLTRVINAQRARDCIELLDQHLYPLMFVESNRIPVNSMSSMRKSHGESLDKVWRFRTAILHRRGTRAYNAAEALGMLAMMRSNSLTAFGEAITGLPLLAPPSVQVICYEHGDYIGPHNDHYPESDPDCLGYVDVHVMFSNDAVAHQFLIYAKNGHLSQIADVGHGAGISVYKLPFWHHVTPLVGKTGHESEARRWLLLGTFDIGPMRTKQNKKSSRQKGSRAKKMTKVVSQEALALPR
jgi:hypothetical protein